MLDEYSKIWNFAQGLGFFKHSDTGIYCVEIADDAYKFSLTKKPNDRCYATIGGLMDITESFESLMKIVPKSMNRETVDMVLMCLLGGLTKLNIKKRKKDLESLRKSKSRKKPKVSERKEGDVWQNNKGEWRIWTSNKTEKICEDCKLKRPSCGIIRKEDETKWYRWCKPCAEKHHEVTFPKKCNGNCGKFAIMDGFCTTCHPDYMPSLRGASKIACEFIDILEHQLRVKIQHKHYDKIALAVTGSEKSIAGSKYRVDGFFPEAKLPVNIKPKGVVVEFYGTEWHGFPNNDRADVRNHKGTLYGDLYDKTIKREQKISAMGYTIIRIFSNQYQTWKKHQVGMSLLSACQIIS